jgi:hypothetical protein
MRHVSDPEVDVRAGIQGGCELPVWPSTGVERRGRLTGATGVMIRATYHRRQGVPHPRGGVFTWAEVGGGGARGRGPARCACET